MSRVEVTGALDPATVLAAREATNGAHEHEEPTREHAAPGSLLARLRSASEAQSAIHEHDEDIGGAYGSMLAIRYRPLSTTAMDRFVAQRQALATNPAALSPLDANMDMMASACVGVVGRDPATGEEELLADADGPVRLEHRLALLLDMPVPPGAAMTAREVIEALFGGNAVAIGAHGDRVMTWMQDPGQEPPAPGRS